MAEHSLKTWPEPFAAVLAGEKTHEVRVNDRGYAVGDVLELREWRFIGDREWSEGAGGHYTGRSVRVVVTHMTRGGSFGLPEDLCVMSIRKEQP